jgi:hypothetical protein
MTPTFTAHNIRLDDGRTTKPEIPFTLDADQRFLAARRLLETVFPGDKSGIRIVDLGCLEGGYTVEFARMGFESLGLEVRDSNLAACHYVKAHTSLPNMSFVQDTVWNLADHGVFDAVFCSGLFYHLDRPRAFLDLLTSVTRKVLILQTHFAPAAQDEADRGQRFCLSEPTEHEGLQGRWYSEFGHQPTPEEREAANWSSWENNRSFWLQRESLLQAIKDAGFDLVLEQFDGLGDAIAKELTNGYYWQDCRGTFVGIKTGA